MNSKKSVFAGMLIIIFAVCILLDRMHVLPEIPLLKLGILLLLIMAFLDSFRRVEFVGMAIPLGAGAWMFKNDIGLSMVPGYLIFIVILLIGIGLGMIFGTKPKHKMCHGHIGDKGTTGDSVSSFYEAEGTFDIDNNFNARTEYVSVKNIKHGKIDNALGSLTVYLNGSTVDPEGATIEMDNGLGSLSVYIPKEFRVQFKTDNGLGNINFHGECSRDESLPLVYVDLDNGLGQVNIFFE